MKAKRIRWAGGIAVLMLAAGCGRAKQEAMLASPPPGITNTSALTAMATPPADATDDDTQATREARTAFATQFAATARAERTQAATNTWLVVPDSPLSPSVDVAAAFPLVWPAPTLTDEQIEGAVVCDPGIRVIEAYAGIPTVADLDTLPFPETVCQWAVLARAYVNASQGGSLPAAGREAYLRTVYGNPALAIHKGDLPSAYGNGLVLVSNPPLLMRVRSVAIFSEFRGYDGSGTGLWLEYALFVNVGADDRVAMRGTAYTHTRRSTQQYSIVSEQIPIATEIDAALAQSLVSSLENLWPVDDAFLPWGERKCAGMIARGETRALIELTNGQTMMVNLTGMPYEGGGSGTLVTLDRQNYVQLSTQFYDSLMRMLAGAGVPGLDVAAEVGAIDCQWPY